MTEADLKRLLSLQQWYFREARLLDERRYDLWLQLVEPVLRYRIPSRRYATPADPRDFSAWSVDAELAGDEGLDLIDDDHEALRARVGRLSSGMAWAETPPSMTRRLVSNVELLGETSDGLRVVSVVFVAKVRAEERVIFSAQRRDLLRPSGSDYRLRERTVVLDEAVLAAANLSLLF